MNALELRKQLLIAESELNRAQLAQEWRAMTHGVREVALVAKTMGAWASAAAALVAGITVLRRGAPAPGNAKPSWFQKILHAGRLAAMIWSAFRARDQKEKSE